MHYRPDDYIIESMPGGASTRCFLRIFLPRIPDFTSAVLMLVDRPFRLEADDFYQVRELLRKIDLPAPRIFEAFERDGAMLLEDLGDGLLSELARELQGDEDCIEEFYRQAIDHLIRLQTRAPHHCRGVRACSRAFDEAKLTWELRFTWRHFCRAFARFRPGGSGRRELRRMERDLCRRIAALPRVLCHRDYHSQNLIAFVDRLYMVDFQDARMGPTAYDLVSLLRDSYTELDDALFARLLVYFVRNHPQLGGGQARALRGQFNLVALQRHLKHLGTFGYQAALGRRDYLQYVPLTLRYLEENLPNFPEYSGAARVLADVFDRARDALARSEER